MLSHQLESKVLNIIERVLNQQPVEDDLVELKAKWPDPPNDAARHIAAHANCAYGQPILWIIGVNERNHTIPGADENEFSNWWNQVKSCFSELEPKILMLRNVPTHSVTVVAMLIETDRAPYVVMTASGGKVSREVTFHANNSVNSATREQLLRILSPVAGMPVLDFVHCDLTFTEKVQGDTASGSYSLAMHLCVLQPQDQQLFVIAQRMVISIISPTYRELLKFFHVGKDNETLDIVGPSRVDISGSGPLATNRLSICGGKPVVLRLEMNSGGLSRPLVGEIELQPVVAQGNENSWTYKS